MGVKLIERFMEKGYTERELVKVRDEVNMLKRGELLESGRKNNDNQDIACFTGFNLQYKSIEKSFKKYWPILLRENSLDKIILKRLRFIYKMHQV